VAAVVMSMLPGPMRMMPAIGYNFYYFGFMRAFFIALVRNSIIGIHVGQTRRLDNATGDRMTRRAVD
jgi:hypothetical protein